MKIYVGSDHGGFEQKKYLIEHLTGDGQSVTDCGSYSTESTDYPDFAVAVGQQVAADTDKETVGILLCRSGEGMEMAANKIPGIRAALVWQPTVAKETRGDNDANILVLPSDFIGNEEALEIARIFLSTPFSGAERHVRRLEKLHNIEHTRYED
ncbi:RpiB/LacA/LacB family sugar-phosphate isomerase [Patescibacteria group bacterium]|nr:RpiB/LacA/LacB family sugar-phosphate isomerase [Patescibacteria group bacterium]